MSNPPQKPVLESELEQEIKDLIDPETREKALLELCKQREHVSHLAPLLWDSFGVITALLQEIISVYPSLTPPTLSAQQSNRVCNALALLQCVASHAETRSKFLKTNIPVYLSPFLHTTSKTRPFEYLRLTSLGVIGALVKTDDEEVIHFLLQSEMIPLCLKIMESGSELSKTVATFIMQKILLDNNGLSHVCLKYERFAHVVTILAKMVMNLVKEPSKRLLKHVIRCYLRLAENPKAKIALGQLLPDPLRDGSLNHILKDDATTRGWLRRLIKLIESARVPPQNEQPPIPGTSTQAPGPSSATTFKSVKNPKL